MLTPQHGWLEINLYHNFILVNFNKMFQIPSNFRIPSRPEPASFKVVRPLQLLIDDKLLRLIQHLRSSKAKWLRLLIESSILHNLVQLRRTKLSRFVTPLKLGVWRKFFESLTSITFSFLNSYNKINNLIFWHTLVLYVKDRETKLNGLSTFDPFQNCVVWPTSKSSSNKYGDLKFCGK